MFRPEIPSSAHAVQLYETSDFLNDAVADFVCAGLAAEEPALIIATPEHREGFWRRLKAREADLTQVVMADARELLSRIVAGGTLDEARFRREVGRLIDSLFERFGSRRVRAYGEMVDLLWRGGERQTALKLEGLWNALQKDRPFSLLCAYVMDDCYTESGVSEVCALHGTTRVPERAQRRIHELEEFIAQAPTAIHSVDGRGRILAANQAELELMGYPASEYVGHPIADFHVEPHVVPPLLERLKRGEVVRDFEARVRRKDGAVRHVLISSSARVDGEVLEYTRCFTRDVTVHRDELLASVLMHDLRNPLSAIVVGAQLAQRSALDERAAGSVRRILSSGERMAHMIDQLLDFTRARTRGGFRLSRTRVDVRDVAASTVEELERAHLPQRILLEVRGDTSGAFDAGRLAQVMSNLLGNALAHGHAGAPVVLTVDGTDPRALRFSTHNLGAVPPELLPILFDPLLHAEHRRAGTRGLGLGLFISRELVNAHGGDLEVTSSALDGTRFTVTLPRVAAPERMPAA